METISTGGAEHSSGHVWRFSDCEFDERRRELRVGGAIVDIEAKPLAVLHQLLLHPGEVVTKDELLEAVWPGTAVVDGSLATAVSKVRRLLRDDGSVIVTVARVGYKLASPVHCQPAPGAAWTDLRLQPGDGIPGRDQWLLARRLDLSPSSEVWLAQHHKTHEPRVFKFAPDAARLKSLKREVTVARLLRESLGERADFVRILEWNFDRHPYFVESEYGGPNLSEWAEGRGGLGNVPVDLRVKVLVDVARAVAAAHGLDILHKDLKPGNILIASAPDAAPQIKIADFGSASLLVPGRLHALGITNLGFTQTGNDTSGLTGTLMYVAPEGLAGQSPTAAADVYALGVLLYQLAAGDFRKPLAPGWESDVDDPLLREDIADAACGDPARRLASANRLAERLVTLERRRAERHELVQQQRASRAAEIARARARARRPWLALAGLVLLAAIVAGFSIYGGSSSEVPSIRAIAVLPLQNTRAEPGIDFLRRALADEIATALSQVRGLQVRPFAATSRYDQPNLDLVAAAREMRVDSLITGQYVQSDGQLHVTLEAIDVGKDHLVWRDSFEAPAESLIAAHVQIGLRVRRGLAPALGASVVEVAAEPRDEEAYALYLRSAALPMEPAVNKQGLEMLERAVTLDPGYAPAWFALARRYYTDARYGSGDLGMLERWESATERGLTLDPDNVGAAAAFIVVRSERGDLIGAYRSATDLVGRRSDSLEAQFALSYVLRYAGLLDEAADRCERALLLDRGMQTTSLRSCAKVFLLRGDYPRTLTYLRLDQGADYAKALTIDMLVRQGRNTEALALGSPNLPEWKSYDLLLACLGAKPASEIARLAESVRVADDPELNYFAAGHLMHCNQTAVALRMLKAAIVANYCSYPSIESDPLLAPARHMPEYGAIRAAAVQCQTAFLSQREAAR